MDRLKPDRRFGHSVCLCTLFAVREDDTLQKQNRRRLGRFLSHLDRESTSNENAIRIENTEAVGLQEVPFKPPNCYRQWRLLFPHWVPSN